jgi:hypothetical protein
VAHKVHHCRYQVEYGATLEQERGPAVVIGEVTLIVRQNVSDRPHRQRHSAPAEQAEDASSA